MKCILFLMCFAALGVLFLGHADSDLMVDPDEQVDVVMALYGGIDNHLSHYTDVTSRVETLLKKPEGFAVGSGSLLDQNVSKDYQSLIIVYNYEQHRYFYNMVDRGMVSVDDLKKLAKLHPSRVPVIPASNPSDDDLTVLFAAYGVSEKFVDVTDAVKKHLHDDEPQGFLANEDAMGGDPHFGWQKSLVIIYADANGRHFYAQANTDPPINKAVIKSALTSK